MARSVFALLLLTTFASSLSAQERRPDPVALVAAQGVSLGGRTRVRTTADERVFGAFAGVTPEGLVLEVADGSYRTIPGSELAEVARRRRAWRKGLGIGASAGGLIGIGLGVFVAALPCDTGPDCDIGTAEAVFNGGLIFGALGGALGALLGSAIEEWHPTEFSRRTSGGR